METAKLRLGLIDAVKILFVGLVATPSGSKIHEYHAKLPPDIDSVVGYDAYGSLLALANRFEKMQHRYGRSNNPSDKKILRESVQNYFKEYYMVMGNYRYKIALKRDEVGNF